MRCPRCKGSGVVDTSPAAAGRAPWLSSDEDCGWCDGTGDTEPEKAEAWEEQP